MWTLVSFVRTVSPVSCTMQIKLLTYLAEELTDFRRSYEVPFRPENVFVNVISVFGVRQDFFHVICHGNWAAQLDSRLETVSWTSGQPRVYRRLQEFQVCYQLLAVCHQKFHFFGNLNTSKSPNSLQLVPDYLRVRYLKYICIDKLFHQSNLSSSYES